MKISKENKKLLNDEFNFVIDKMENAKNADEILYYFTGFYNVIHRIYNTEFCEELLFTFMVLETSYRTILERIKHLQSGQTTIPFPNNFGDEFIDIIKRLTNDFYNKNERLKTLHDLYLLAYTTTGNGYYLLQKGFIKTIPEEKTTEDDMAK